MPENAVGQKAKPYSCNFIEPGIVSYRDIGIVLVKKEALDKMAKSFEGCPVFNGMHKDVSARDFTDNLKDGTVDSAVWNPQTGWFDARFFADNADTIRNCEGGSFSVSCAYDVTKWGPGGVYHNIPYAAEVLDGVYTHLAIVPNPRYEAARIIYNAKGGHMKLMFWKKNDEVKNASEVELENATVAIGDEEVPISKMITLWNSEEAKKKAAAATSRMNDDDIILVSGKRVTVGELKASYLANAAAKKNDDDDDSEEEKEKKRKAKEAAEKDKKENADDDDDSDEEKAKKKKAKEEADRKNADDKKKKEDDEKEEERKNAIHFQELQNAARTRPHQFEAPKVMTPEQKVQEGNKRYGPITTGGN